VAHLEPADACRLLAVENRELRAQVTARHALEAAKAASAAKNALFDSLIQKYGLDPSVPYVLDEETLMLTPQPTVLPPESAPP
jgi:hypothetical protein